MTPPPTIPKPPGLRGYLSVFQYSRRALELVAATSRPLMATIAALTVLGGVLPAAVAYVGRLIVDSVVEGIALREDSGTLELGPTLHFVAAELSLVVVGAGVARGLSVCESLLRAMLGHRVNVMILEKALSLQLAHFEDSEFYDKLTRARRQASSRPLSLVRRTFGLAQQAIALVSFGGLLWQFSPWAVLVLGGAGLPAFLAEAKFSGDAFRLSRWRSPQARQQAYLETVLAREDYVKEVKLYGLGPLLLERYRSIFATLFDEDRLLTLRRGWWGFVLGVVSTLAFYGAYGWIAWAAVAGKITLGEMTMYLLLFKQGQSAVSAALSSIGGMYEDNLYLSNLYEYLEQEVDPSSSGETKGPNPQDGIRLERVSFTYPGASRPALSDVSLHVRPGEALALVGENGSGKTTLIKLLARLYKLQTGRVLIDGLDVREWDDAALRRRVGIIFQDFARYQMLVGENLGAGDVEHFTDEARWRTAAALGLADRFIDELPFGYQTQLGRWFSGGRELSGGQWQKVALSRAFMRQGADILVLDEPTAAMDAEAEAAVFNHVRDAAGDKITILISHRFSTVRMADRIVVLEGGRVIEQGSHDVLMAEGGRYAKLFRLQAAGYR